MVERKILLESWVIILILALAAYMFIRSHRKAWAGSVLPLMLVPVVSLLDEQFNRQMLRFGAGSAYLARVVVYAVALTAACLWSVLWAKRLPAGKSRLVYRILAVTFNALVVLFFLRDLVIKPYFGLL